MERHGSEVSMVVRGELKPTLGGSQAGEVVA